MMMNDSLLLIERFRIIDLMLNMSLYRAISSAVVLDVIPGRNTIHDLCSSRIVSPFVSLLQNPATCQ